MVNDLLRKLGFSDKEIKVYLAILENGRISPANLAKATGINRTTVYSIAKQLIKRGIIAEDLGGISSRLVALSTKDLENLAKQEEKQLEEKRQLIQQTIGELNQVVKSSKYSIPKIVFIDEEHLEDYLYKQTQTWNKSILKADGIWWGFQDPTFVEHYKDWIDWYWQQTNKLDVFLRLLTTESEVEKEMERLNYPKRKMKFWNHSSFTGSTWINGDHLIMIVTNKRPHYLVEIHDAVLAHNMRELFKGIWKSL